MEQGSPESIGTKVWWRHWSVVFVLAVVVAFVVWALIKTGPWLRGWQERRTADALREQAEEQLHNDKYGGKTPEETFVMFIAALEKGDVELASKYFVLQKQDEWLKTLEEYKEQVLLKDFAVELKNTKNNWVKAKSSNSNIIQYDSSTLIEKDSTVILENGNKIRLPKGNYANATIFEKYPSEIWKIKTL